MKYYYIRNYTNYLDYPDKPWYTVKLDHKPTYEEICKNKPIREIEAYCVEHRYETTIEGELLVSRWQADTLCSLF